MRLRSVSGPVCGGRWQKWPHVASGLLRPSHLPFDSLSGLRHYVTTYSACLCHLASSSNSKAGCLKTSVKVLGRAWREPPSHSCQTKELPLPEAQIGAFIRDLHRLESNYSKSEQVTPPGSPTLQSSTSPSHPGAHSLFEKVLGENQALSAGRKASQMRPSSFGSLKVLAAGPWQCRTLAGPGCDVASQ